VDKERLDTDLANLLIESLRAHHSLNRLLGIVVYGVSFVFQFPLPSADSLLCYAALALIGIGLLGELIGAPYRFDAMPKTLKLLLS
jgi:hypothetical protein